MLLAELGQHGDDPRVDPAGLDVGDADVSKVMFLFFRIASASASGLPPVPVALLAELVRVDRRALHRRRRPPARDRRRLLRRRRRLRAGPRRPPPATPPPGRRVRVTGRRHAGQAAEPRAPRAWRCGRRCRCGGAAGAAAAGCARGAFAVRQLAARRRLRLDLLGRQRAAARRRRARRPAGASATPLAGPSARELRAAAGVRRRVVAALPPPPPPPPSAPCRRPCRPSPRPRGAAAPPCLPATSGAAAAFAPAAAGAAAPRRGRRRRRGGAEAPPPPPPPPLPSAAASAASVAGSGAALGGGAPASDPPPGSAGRFTRLSTSPIEPDRSSICGTTWRENSYSPMPSIAAAIIDAGERRARLAHVQRVHRLARADRHLVGEAVQPRLAAGRRRVAAEAVAEARIGEQSLDQLRGDVGLGRGHDSCSHRLSHRPARARPAASTTTTSAGTKNTTHMVPSTV